MNVLAKILRVQAKLMVFIDLVCGNLNKTCYDIQDGCSIRKILLITKCCHSDYSEYILCNGTIIV